MLSYPKLIEETCLKTKGQCHFTSTWVIAVEMLNKIAVGMEGRTKWRLLPPLSRLYPLPIAWAKSSGFDFAYFSHSKTHTLESWDCIAFMHYLGRKWYVLNVCCNFISPFGFLFQISTYWFNWHKFITISIIRWM